MRLLLAVIIVALFVATVQAAQCPTGMFLTGASPTCASCPLGKFSNTTTATVCRLCAINTYASAVNMTRCSTCGTGMYSITGAAYCVGCAAGRISPGYAMAITPYNLTNLEQYAAAARTFTIGATAGAIHGNVASQSTITSGVTIDGRRFTMNFATNASISLLYSSLMALSCTTIGTSLVDTTRTPGVYCAASFSLTTGTLTLDAQWSTTARFIFLAKTSIATLGTTAAIELINGAQPSQVAFVCINQCSVGLKDLSASGLRQQKYGLILSAGIAQVTGPNVIAHFYGESSMKTLNNLATLYVPGASQTISCALQCTPGYFSANGTAGCTICAAGKYSTVNGTTACTACLAGKFSTTTGGTSSSACSSCPAGKYNTVATGVTICTNCTAGKYSNTTGNVSPLSCGQCPTLKFSDSGASACWFCNAGRYYSGSTCLGCQIGRFMNHTAATVCDLCQQGRYGDTTGRTICINCPTPGTTTISTGKTSAGDCQYCPVGYGGFLCTTPCDSGTFSNTTGPVAGSAACVYCGAGRFTPVDGQPHTVCNDCAAGKTVDRATDHSQCIDCGTGRYSFSGHDGTASTCWLCGAGKIAYTNHTGCAACPPATFVGFAGTTNTVCFNCQVGRFSTATGASVCLLCPPGQFQNVTAQTACKRCETGRFQGASGRTRCEFCIAGRYSYNSTKVPGGQYVSCRACPVGKFTSVQGQGSSCSACPVGRISNNATGASFCTACAAGSFSNNATGATACNLCPAGHFNNVTGSSSSFCYTCDGPRAYAPGTGASRCLQCASGYLAYANRTGCADIDECLTANGGCAANVCVNTPGSRLCKCRAGTRSGDGNVPCTNCTAGQFSNSTGARFCYDCESGHWNSLATDGVSTQQASHADCPACPAGKTQAVQYDFCSDCQTGWSPPGRFGATTCELCPIGQAPIVPVASGCTACAIGRFKTASTGLPCSTCATGKYWINRNTTCSFCPPGKFTNATVQTTCRICEPGRFQGLPGKTRCEFCIAGRYSTNSSKTTQLNACHACPLGKFSSNKGQPSCTACPPGRASSNFTGATICAACSAGLYSNNATGAALCPACPAGTYNATTGASRCTACAAGSYSTGTACVTCRQGTFANVTGLSACYTCTGTRYAPGNAATSCQVCPTGYTGNSTHTGCTDFDECQVNNGGCALGCTNTIGSRTCGPCLNGLRGNGVIMCSDVGQSQFIAAELGGQTRAPGCYRAVGDAAFTITGTLTLTGAGVYAFYTPAAINPAASSLVTLSNGALCGDVHWQSGAAATVGANAIFVGTLQTVATITLGANSVTIGTLLPGNGITSFGSGASVIPCANHTFANCTDINECLSNNGGCSRSPFVTCTNSYGSRTCAACPFGYTGTGVANCTDVNECLSANGGCDSLSVCTNTPGSRTCGACPLGYSGTGATACTPCGLGRYGSAIATCTDCRQGTFGNTTHLTVCYACLGNRISAGNAASACTVCASGYTGNSTHTGCVNINECLSANGGCDLLTTCTDTPGSRTCSACPLGYSGTGASACVPCSIGQYGSAVATCTSCPRGRFANTTHQAVCYLCPGNTVAVNLASSSCASCATGYATNATHVECLNVNECLTSNGGCDSVSVCTDTAGSRTCGACPLGYSGTGLTGCTACSTGRYGSAIATCTDCLPGSFANTTLQTICYNCEGNTFAASSAATTCSNCPVHNIATTDHTACDPVPVSSSSSSSSSSSTAGSSSSSSSSSTAAATLAEPSGIGTPTVNSMTVLTVLGGVIVVGVFVGVMAFQLPVFAAATTEPAFSSIPLSSSVAGHRRPASRHEYKRVRIEES